MALLLTVEHGGNRVPAMARELFRAPSARALLNTHRGWDPGAAPLARVLYRALARRVPTTLVSATVTRLLVDLNRSPTNPRVFSAVTRSLDRLTRRRLLERFHRPHHQAVMTAVGDEIAAGRRVIHVGVHTFTPVLDGVRRTMDAALLFDPARRREAALAIAWQHALAQALAASAVTYQRVARNAPYRGTSDGLTTILRRMFPARCYLGLELEVNQRLPLAGGAAWRHMQAAVARSLGAVIDSA